MSLCSVVETLIVSLVRWTKQGTRSPIELLWTAKNTIRDAGTASIMGFMSYETIKDVLNYRTDSQGPIM